MYGSHARFLASIPPSLFPSSLLPDILSPAVAHFSPTPPHPPFPHPTPSNPAFPFYCRLACLEATDSTAMQEQQHAGAWVTHASKLDTSEEAGAHAHGWKIEKGADGPPSSA